MESFIQVITTTESKEEAKIIATYLVDEKLAACVQVLGPISSTYRWKGKTETAKEWLCLIKTKEGFYYEIEKAIKSLHSYEIPEIIALPIIKGSADYLSWLDYEVTE